MYMQIADYMRYKYPDVIYRFDLAADLFIAFVRFLGDRYYHGLFLEIKRPDVKIYKKNGELVANSHIREQAAVLDELRKCGYKAEFACGFDEAKKIIDEYLG